MADALFEKIRARAGGFASALPTKQVAGKFIDQLLSAIFANATESVWPQEKSKLRNELEWLIAPFHADAKNLAQVFFEESLPELYDIFWEDAEAAYAGDPAAQNIQEVILAYPGFYGVVVYRISHYFFELKIPTLPRLFSEYAHEKTGIDIHPGAKIGKSFFMDHGTGIVIGGTSIIADNVKIYQGVTLGALSVDKSLASTKRHPTIEEGVVIYAGSTILGGQTVIGRQSVIGGNTWIVESVEPFSVVYNKNSSRVRPAKEVTGLIDFTI